MQQLKFVPFIETYSYLENKMNSLSTTIQEVKDLLKTIFLMIQKPLHTPKKFQQKCKIFFGQR
jgi:hypothetical protein